MEIADEYLNINIAACTDGELAIDCPVRVTKSYNSELTAICWWNPKCVKQVTIIEAIELVKVHIAEAHPDWVPSDTAIDK